MTITSIHCEVHEASLLLSVRACFHIHLISKNLINKTTAKAALTQIISVTHQRMETKDADLAQADSFPPRVEDNNGVAVEATQQVNAIITTGTSSGATVGLDADGTGPATADPSHANGHISEVPAEPATGGQPAAVALQFPSVFHKDAYLLFRALCKLSSKNLSEETQTGHNETIHLQNK